MDADQQQVSADVVGTAISVAAAWARTKSAAAVSLAYAIKGSTA